MPRERSETRYRKRGRFGLLYKLLSLILILAAVVAGTVVFFQVEDIQVEGVSRYSAEQIVTASGVTRGDNLLLLPASRITASLLAALPYVNEVRLERDFPTTLRLVVDESAPAVAMETDGNWWLLGANGRILEQVDVALAGQYPQATGFYLVSPRAGSQAQAASVDAVRLTSMVEMLAALEDRGMLDKIGWLDVSSATEMRFAYDDRVTVEILMNADYPRKMWILEEILASVGENARGVVDLKSDRCYFRPA